MRYTFGMSAPPIRPDLLLLALGPIFLFFVLGEFFLYRKAHPERFERRDTVNNIVLSLLNQAAELFFLWANWLFLGSLAGFLNAHGLHLVPETMPFFWIVLLFLAQDFLYYWFHRASHRVRWFWSAHVAHHSSEYLNFSTALRQSALYPFTAGMALFYLPLAYVGFPIDWIAFAVAINLAFQFFVHTQAVGRMGPLERIFNTPSHHRVHHAKNPIYVDRNYAGIFIVWDRMFGTFVPEDEPCRYGITKPVDFRDPIDSNLHEFKAMVQDVKTRRGWRQKLAAIFGPP